LGSGTGTDDRVQPPAATAETTVAAAFSAASAFSATTRSTVDVGESIAG
jgi:hypothetical protein